MVFGKLMDRKQFVVTCKNCGENTPAGRDEFPFVSLVVDCKLCGAKRQYRPSEVFQGRASSKLKSGNLHR
jgi:transcription elongation factor Elf1